MGARGPEIDGNRRELGMGKKMKGDDMRGGRERLAQQRWWR